MKIKFSAFCLFTYLTFLISCGRHHREDVVEDYYKFLYENKIDTSTYRTLEELDKENKIQKITVGKIHDSFINTEAKTVILKLDRQNKDQFYQKLDYYGNILDSIEIKKDYELLQHYIIDHDYYITWIYDSDKSKKKVRDLNVSPEDTISQKKIIAKILKSHLSYTIKSDNNDNNINKPKDSAAVIYSYVYFVENGKIFKMNVGQEENNIYGLESYGYENEINDIFKKLENMDNISYVKFDNYYAKKRIFHPVNCALFSVNGCGPDITYYTGTAFLSSEDNSVRIRYPKNPIEGFFDSPYYYFDTYSDPQLRFFIITENVSDRPYYLVKK
ncbi:MULTISPECIES: hypothetical protein [Chryseobacterium]|uniref:Lipoprotein n=1 Tax=Chryseobacterium camelliae TaxID=1265445 RepID=A0ABU0TN00_9FLAO|nr:MULTISPECIES: hypothetical protein [Chryseobacterium]MDT3407718.1 hypothetical protein [Pseudacidovorax intermedius]MDQ1098430.1 hypothetical protein [Chryseobacterium camelliae]MDQ1102354.1 hypothetical protein [Chryseobacterium sp. SORGH_AS_1048]MDR6085791.1 hypothetical protein [Chryseobacterium sp. SORGH_AS_0909]MDR6130154.1 hypothetical protein [Chryseobacterium sp. SORGH_AS_1175]